MPRTAEKNPHVEPGTVVTPIENGTETVLIGPDAEKLGPLCSHQRRLSSRRPAGHEPGDLAVPRPAMRPCRSLYLPRPCHTVGAVAPVSMQRRMVAFGSREHVEHDSRSVSQHVSACRDTPAPHGAGQTCCRFIVAGRICATPTNGTLPGDCSPRSRDGYPEPEPRCALT